jgi:hypothetical protein
MPNTLDVDEDGYDRDRVVAAQLGVAKKTLPRWDASEKMRALGWPLPVYFNGRRHRHRGAIREFVKNAATAYAAKPAKT